MEKYRCENCGQTIETQTPIAADAKCPSCGEAKLHHEHTNSGQQQGYDPNMYNSAYQNGYQQGFNTAYSQYREPGVFESGPSGKSRGVAALLAIFLGTLGIHYFYLGKNTAGVVFLLCSLLTCGILGCVIEIVSFVQGIVFLTMTQAEFERKFVYSADTVPLF